MKILFITPHFLDENGGGSFASRAFINAFSEIADSIVLLYPDRGKPIDKFIHKKCILKGISDNRSKFKKAIDIYRGRLHRFKDYMLIQNIDFKPDIVVFDNSICTSGMINYAKQLGIKIITIHHNYEMEYYSGSKENLFIAWRYTVLHYIKLIEKAAVLNSDLNITLTDADINLLQINYNPEKKALFEKLGCFESSSNPVLTNDILAVNNQPRSNNLCFAITGSLNSYQTEISIIPFLVNEYPELLKILPESKLIIAGSNPSKKLIKTCTIYPSIKLIPNPQNMQEVLNQADIYICPTCVGGGLKLRVMDGLKAGLPVLTHVVSARGYEDFKNANCLFTYEDKTSFILNLKKIISEKNKGHLEKKEIKNLYNSTFSFESGVKKLKEILIRTMV